MKKLFVLSVFFSVPLLCMDDFEYPYGYDQAQCELELKQLQTAAQILSAWEGREQRERLGITLCFRCAQYTAHHVNEEPKNCTHCKHEFSSSSQQDPSAVAARVIHQKKRALFWSPTKSAEAFRELAVMHFMQRSVASAAAAAMSSDAVQTQNDTGGAASAAAAVSSSAGASDAAASVDEWGPYDDGSLALGAPYNLSSRCP